MKRNRGKMLPWAVALSVIIHAGVFAGVHVSTFRHKSEKESVYRIQFLKEGGGSLDRRPERAEPAASVPEPKPEVTKKRTPEEPEPVKKPEPEKVTEKKVSEKKKKPVEEQAPETPTFSNSHFGDPSTGENSGGGATRLHRTDWQASYKKKVLARIQDAKRYPFAARRMSLEGRVVVEFRVSSSGALENVGMVEGSGHSILDSDALAWVRRAAPFPPFPPDVRGDSISFTYGLTYDLKD